MTSFDRSTISNSIFFPARPQEIMRRSVMRDCRVLLGCLTSASMNNHLLVKSPMRVRAHILLLALSASRPFRCHMQGNEVQIQGRCIGLFHAPSTLRAMMATRALRMVREEGKSLLSVVPAPKRPSLRARRGFLRRHP